MVMWGEIGPDALLDRPYATGQLRQAVVGCVHEDFQPLQALYTPTLYDSC